MLITLKVYKYRSSGKFVAGPYERTFIPLNSDLTFSSQESHRIMNSTELDDTPYRLEVEITNNEFRYIRRWDERHLPEKSQDSNVPLEERIDITPAQGFNQAEKNYAGISTDPHWLVGTFSLAGIILGLYGFGFFFSDSDTKGWGLTLAAFALFAFVAAKIIDMETRSEGATEKISEIKEAKERLRKKIEIHSQKALKDIKFWESLDGVSFEKAVSKVFRDKGYSVQHTPRSNDKGVDLILEKETRQTIVQCKAYTRNVGVAAVRELQGSRGQFPGADYTMLVCLFDFSRPAKEFAQEHGIKLFSIARDYLQIDYRP